MRQHTNRESLLIFNDSKMSQLKKERESYRQTQRKISISQKNVLYHYFVVSIMYIFNGYSLNWNEETTHKRRRHACHIICIKFFCSFCIVSQLNNVIFSPTLFMANTYPKSCDSLHRSLSSVLFDCIIIF